MDTLLFLKGKIKSATTEKQLLKSLGLPDGGNDSSYIEKNPSKRLSLDIKRAFELAEGIKEASKISTPQREEQTVRALLKLATAPVTASLLSQCDQAGKKMRKLRNHPVRAVANASEAVVKAWKQTLTSS